MDCVCCGSMAVTARAYRRFRCRTCGMQFNERSGGVLNRTCLPSDVIAFVGFCRLRYRLTFRDLSEIMALRGIEVSYEAVRAGRRAATGHGRGSAQAPAWLAARLQRQVGTSMRRI